MLNVANQWVQFSVSTPAQKAVADMLTEASLPYEGHESYFKYLTHMYEDKMNHLIESVTQAGLIPLRPEVSEYVYVSFLSHSTFNDFSYYPITGLVLLGLRHQQHPSARRVPSAVHQAQGRRGASDEGLGFLPLADQRHRRGRYSVLRVLYSRAQGTGVQLDPSLLLQGRPVAARSQN